jgi:hypothetical protein
LLRQVGWAINDKRVDVSGDARGGKQPRRGKLWPANGSYIRLRPQHRDHVWSYHFVEDRTHDGRRYRMLNVLDEFTHECLAIRIARLTAPFQLVARWPARRSPCAFVATLLELKSRPDNG